MIKNKLSINLQKTQCMLIGSSKRLQKCRNLNINFSGVQIEFVKQAKLLGIYIDNTLSWNAHIDFISKKIIGKLAVLRRVSYFMPPNALQEVLIALCFHILLIVVLSGVM